MFAILFINSSYETHYYSFDFHSPNKDPEARKQIEFHVFESLIWSIEYGQLRMSLDEYIPHKQGGIWVIEVRNLETEAMASDGRMKADSFGSTDSTANVLKSLIQPGNWQIIQNNERFHVDGMKATNLMHTQDQLYYSIYVEEKKNPDKVGGQITVVGTITDGQIYWYYDDCKCNCR
jgi:hypothetical protein